jgi:hypothetical protein
LPPLRHYRKLVIFQSAFLPFLGRRLIIADPDADGDEFACGEKVLGRLVVAGGDAAIVFDLVEEALDKSAPCRDVSRSKSVLCG